VTRIAVVVVALALTAMTRPARAFPTGDQFDGDSLTTDGGSGIAFDGAPRWTGHDCAVCHTGAPGRISLSLEADPVALFDTGWVPGQQYHLRVTLAGEWAGLEYAANGDNCGFGTDPYAACNQNGFAIELADASGAPAGSFAPVANGACADGSATDTGIYIFADGGAVAHDGNHASVTSWDLCWTAPAAGTGTITAFLSAVDGNGGDGTQDFTANTTGDDVATGQVPLAEAGAPASAQTGGCAAGGTPGLALVALMLLALCRRRPARALAALVAVAGLATGCAHVRPSQRETLAKRKMQFAPDPVEDELDLHMQEAREGSSGGYGSSGGGCGCN
jgi:hypothetical protein